MEKKRLKKTQKESMIKREDKHSRNKRGENIDRKDGSPKESQSQMDRTGTCDSSTVKRDDLDWWKQFDTYKVGPVADSCSTMHKIAEQEFTLDDFSCEHLFNGAEEGTEFLKDFMYTIKALNKARETYLETKKNIYWWQMIQLLPSSYNQRRTVVLNYEVLRNACQARKHHKLDEWFGFYKWAESLPYSELILEV